MLRNFGMEKQIILLIILFSTLAFLSSCDSAGYDLEEESVDAPKTETKTDIKEDLNQPKPEIKQEINKYINKKDHNPLRKTYAIQIGAFGSESNARTFLALAKSKRNYDINYYQIDGLYKVRVGAIGTVADALNILSKAREEGFLDSFVVELK
jgi:cell division septation protein DedD